VKFFDTANKLNWYPTSIATTKKLMVPL